MIKKDRPKVLMYYSFGDRIGGPLTYIFSIINSELNEEFEFATCFQNETAGGMSFTLLKRMVKEIKRESPDIVHVHGLQSEGFYGVLAAKLAGCKHIVTTVHGFAFDGQNKRGLKWFLYRYVVEPITLRLSDRVYCVCDYAAHRSIIVKNTKKNNYGYIHNAVGEIKASYSREEIRNKLGISPQETVFVIVGRVTVAKGFKTLEETIRILNNENLRDFRMLIVGDGEYLENFCNNMSSEIESRQIIVIGQTDSVADYLNASDVFILPSNHENLPIAILEAGKMHLPCIASNVGGVPEIVIDGKNGFLVDSRNGYAYAEKMKMLAEDKALRYSMGETMKNYIDEYFSMSYMCRKIKEVYEYNEE